MRYRADTPEAIGTADDMLFTGTAVYTLCIGVAFVVVGIYARQWWLVVSGGVLALASGVYLAYPVFA
ncbi:MAG: hypothetical protein H6978_15885 [Gammaproteobacteria bacterium]|nr:hypothetical protein [Gammaproteobacteria bacterium]